jgi:hypothetical protein
VSGRFKFIPWGADGAFADANPFDPFNTTRTVYAQGRIARRLYDLPEERQRFRDRLEELRGSLWDETVLVSELDGWTARATDAWPPATVALRSHLQAHGALLDAELDQPAPEWIDPPLGMSPCAGTQSDVRIEFSTAYGDLDDLMPEPGAFEVGLALDGAPFEGFWLGRAGVDAMATEPGVTLRTLSISATGSGVILQLMIPEAEFAPGSRPLHGFESFGIVLALDAGQARLVGFVGGGALELDEASQEPGAPVSGRLDARLLQLDCAGM